MMNIHVNGQRIKSQKAWNMAKRQRCEEIEELWERVLNPDKTAKILEHKAEGKQEGRCMDEDSRINPSSSRAIQAEVMEEGEDSLAGWKEPSVYKDCTEGGKTSSSSLSIKGGEKVEEAAEGEFVK
ncbi:hypothetical protein RIR_jg9066.t1 [Rhizophagus irregularis DAOM 181602=DAOM 197198]|nr:hypothetical protein RIR_jg9066.t1 [Rhizophagus irregularis DAOM 181602=DAOM 197198]